MSVRWFNSIVTWLGWCPRQHSHRHKTSWATLPIEIREYIVDLVENPSLTAKVNRDFQHLSTHCYTVLLKKYEAYADLIGLVSTSQRQLLPAIQVQTIYQTIITEAKHVEIDLQDFKTEGSPFHSLRLHQIRTLSSFRFADKAAYFQSIYDWITLSFNGKTDKQIIETAEEYWSSDHESMTNLRNSMNLSNRHLTHVPAHIRHLKNLMTLNLNDNQLTVLPPEMASLTALTTLHIRGNPLITESVRTICFSLPNLKKVVIDNAQLHLIELFNKSFPHLSVTVTQIVTEEEPL